MSTPIRGYSVGQSPEGILRMTIQVDGSPNVILRLRQLDTGPDHKGLAIDIDGDFPHDYDDLSITVNDRLADLFEERPA